MANLKMYNPSNGKKSTFKLDPNSYYDALKDPFELKELESFNLIKTHLREHKKSYVATSHGKDSLVLSHLVIRAYNELIKEEHKITKPEFWLNNTLNIYKEEKPFWDMINKWLGIEDTFHVFIPPKLPNGKQATVWSVAEMVGHLPSFRKSARHKSMSYKHSNIPECCDWLKKKAIKTFLKELPIDERFDLAFVGTRGQESNIRRMGVLQRCRSYIIKSRVAYPIRTVTPLSFWKDYDVFEYFTKYNIPKNPVYNIHKLNRMGCASCPAYKNWELDQASDPTKERQQMLRQNLKILKETEPNRYLEVIENLKKHHLMPELWNQTTLELIS